MSLHIVIDGYNLIRQSPSLSAAEQQSLEQGREALVERLVSYRKFKHHRITIVFDGAEAYDLGERRTRWKGIEIVFSRPGELADSVIKRMASRERERIIVVTSDREISDFANSQGAATIDSVAFESKMEMATMLGHDGDDFGDERDTGWEPTTKKKGPSRRRSKRERKSRARTRKL
jgi:predicted RNA-binding protein with PIN domain